VVGFEQELADAGELEQITQRRVDVDEQDAAPEARCVEREPTQLVDRLHVQGRPPRRHHHVSPTAEFSTTGGETTSGIMPLVFRR